jgi:uncharacterized protein YjbI with pentapeptide repeats
MTKDNLLPAPANSSRLLRIGSDLESEELRALFCPRSDLTFRLIEGLTLSDLAVVHSLFSGSILRRCSFSRMDFSRCDFDGVRFEHCSFVDCNFSPSENRATEAYHTSFTRCNFDSSVLEDYVFVAVTLSHCSFQNSMVTHCSFAQSLVAWCSWVRSSITHSTFIETEIRDLTLGDCTILYIVFRFCTFSKVALNAESMGMIFGLRRSDLKNISFIYLGANEGSTADLDIVEALVASYEERRWFLGAAMLRLNFRLISLPLALSQYISLIVDEAIENRRIRRDDLLFLANIFKELDRAKDLPAMSCIQALDAVRLLLNEPAMDNQELNDHNREALQRFGSAVYLLLQDMIEEFEAKRVQLSSLDTDLPMVLKITFEKRPNLDVAQLLGDIANRSGLATPLSTHLLETGQGSYVELLMTGLFTVLCIQIFLFLLNGCVFQATELRARIEVLSKRDVPAVFKHNALRQAQEVPEFLVAPMQVIMRHALSLPLMNDSELGGMTRKNIKQLEVGGETDLHAHRVER